MSGIKLILNVVYKDLGELRGCKISLKFLLVRTSTPGIKEKAFYPRLRGPIIDKEYMKYNEV